MIQKIRNWFRTEYQRAVAILPRLMVTSTVIIVILGIVLTCFWSIMETRQKEQQSKLRIGYVAEDDMLTKLLVAYVAGLDSVDEWCRFVSVTEEEGKEDLQEGKIAALIILPDNVVDEILSGSNAPATLLLPKESSVLGIVFEELADAGIRMLSVAQGEIYTVYELASVLGFSEEELHSMCDDINAYNLSLVMERESWFQTCKVSVTGNEETAVYYGSALVACLLLLCVVFFGSYVKHSELEALLTWKRLGVSPVIQVLGRTLITAMLLFLCMLPLAGLWMLPWLRNILVPVFTWQSIVLLLLSVICIAAYDQLLYQICEQHRVAVVLVGLLAIVQGYVSGYLIPTVLLPQVIQRLSLYMPSTYVRQAISMFFSGDTENMGKICLRLLISCFCFFIINIIMMYVKTRNYANGSATVRLLRRGKSVRIRGTVFGIYAKRLLYRKSFWCCLIMIMLISVGLVSMERQSETTITAAIYDESGEWEEQLCDYEGYIQFLLCDSEDEVRELVLHDEVECGYRIPKDFRDKLQTGTAKKSIACYKDSDALMADTVNEILFEQLFTQLSKEWFAGYISETDELLTVLENKITDGSTFSIEKEYWQTDIEESTSERQERTTYPVKIVIFSAIILCGMTGVWEAIEDYRKYHFFKRKPETIVVISILQPIICGVIMGIFMFLLNPY